MIYENIVIGTGLSALGCILGLIKNKKKVLCIDASNGDLDDLGKEDSKRVIFCNQGLPLRKIKERFSKRKLFHPLDIIDNYLYGGLSNIWGANALRPLSSDIESWPIKYSTLEPYFKECEKIMNISHFDDSLSEEFGIDKKNFNQSKKILFSDFIKNFLLNNKKKNKNFIHGLARLTLEEKCQISENSFFGCKDENIFNSKNEIKKLINQNKIEFKSNLILKKINFNDGKIELDFEGNQKTVIKTKKLFLGAGPINSPRIILNSLQSKETLTIKESQPFFIPCFYFGKNFDNKKKHHTLSQAQIVFNKKKEVNTNNTYYEIKYDYNLIDAIIRKKYSFFFYLIPKFLKKRIFVITGFINSKDSPFSAKIDKDNKDFKILERKELLSKNRKKILSQLKTLEKEFSFLSFRPLLKFGKFGRGFHLGSSLPMQLPDKDSNYLATDLNGEFINFKNVFIVDSSNFPNIPASGFSLTVMANAFRIGDTVKND